MPFVNRAYIINLNGKLFAVDSRQDLNTVEREDLTLYNLRSLLAERGYALLHHGIPGDKHLDYPDAEIVEVWQKRATEENNPRHVKEG